MFGKLLKPLTFLLCLLPLIWVLYQIGLLQQGSAHELGADPGKEIVQFLGEWALRFLILTLFVTPLRQLLKWAPVARIRRMLGLFTFFYAFVHLMSYFVFLLELNINDVLTDVIKRPYITIGFLAFLILLPLAITSNRWMIRRMKQRWKKLHQFVYLAAIMAVVHLVWLTRTDYTQAVIYSALVALLLLFRLYRAGIIPGLFSRKTLILSSQKNVLQNN